MIFSNGIGTQVSFIWKGASPSYSTVMNILKMLVSLSTLKENNTSILEIFTTSQSSQLFTFTDLKSKSNIEAKELTKQIVNLCASEVIELIYRLKASKAFKSFDNVWRSNIVELRNDFEFIDDDKISGRDDNNIEVAFRLNNSGGRI